MGPMSIPKLSDQRNVIASSLSTQWINKGCFSRKPLSPLSLPRPPIGLDLFRTPAGIGLAHVRGGLDGWDELENDVGDTDDADDGAGNYAQDAVVEQDGADEDVDCDSIGVSRRNYSPPKLGGGRTRGK